METTTPAKAKKFFGQLKNKILPTLNGTTIAMHIGGFQKTTLIDYPGRVASIVFVKGCNMRCGYCYNASLVLGTAKEIPVEEIISQLELRKKYIDAVVVTGGEPTVWPDLPDFLHQLKGLGFLIKLDTNGLKPQMLAEILSRELVDYIAMDVKAPWNKYDEIACTHVLVEMIMESILLVKQSGVDYEFRTTAAPGLTREDINEIALQIKPAKRWFLQPFIAAQSLLDASVLEKPFLKESELLDIIGGVKEFFEECGVRGIY